MVARGKRRRQGQEAEAGMQRTREQAILEAPKDLEICSCLYEQASECFSHWGEKIAELIFPKNFFFYTFKHVSEWNLYFPSIYPVQLCIFHLLS